METGSSGYRKELGGAELVTVFCKLRTSYRQRCIEAYIVGNNQLYILSYSTIVIITSYSMYVSVGDSALENKGCLRLSIFEHSLSEATGPTLCT
jgi:hypothetical protein